MRRLKASAALVALALLGGCAAVPPPETVAGGRAAARGPAVACTTADVLLATVSKCGSGGFALGVAAE